MPWAGPKADLLPTVLPYNAASSRKSAAVKTIANDDMDQSAFRRFLADALRALVSSVKPGAGFCEWRADLHRLTED